MKLLRLFLVLPVLGLLVGLAYVAQENGDRPAAKMTDAADRFLAALNGDQKMKAALDFDDKERFNWHFTPYQDSSKKPKHRGLPLEDMNKEQKEAALALLKAGTSQPATRKPPPS